MKNNFINQQPNQTLAKALLILDTFNMRQTVWGVRELSRELDINPATIYRILSTLTNAGYLEQDHDTQRYSLGPKVLRLGNLYLQQNPLPETARKVFETFADRFQYNFYLGTLVNFQLVYLAVFDGRGPIKIVVETGGVISLHSTALGKVLLAYQSDEFIRQFMETVPLTRHTPRSIDNKETLWEQIHQIREQKYAINDGEHYDEVGAIGVPIHHKPNRVKLGVSLAYPRHLMLEKRIDIENLVGLANQVASEIALRTAQIT
jgi:IclR family transcriptional regulator, KDG regulon repressor